jgi:hypothetical protein
MLHVEMIESRDTVLFMTICVIALCCLLVTGVLVEEICVSCDDQDDEELRIT